MKTILTMTAYDRADLLDKALESLLVTYPCGADQIFVVADTPKDPRVLEVLRKWKNTFVQPDQWSYFDFDITPSNRGVARATNYALDSAAGRNADFLIHVDSDTFIERKDWCKDVVKFLQTHPEVGLVAPDLPGRYMRIHRPDYDEIEYALGMVWATSTQNYYAVRHYFGEGFFDENIQHQFDPDVCYRIRQLNKRIGIIDIGKLVDLGVGSGDSSRSEIVWKGGFEFLKKWNTYFVGQFNYKSPMMLRWDEFPLNYLWRRTWLAQCVDVNTNPQRVALQGHTFEMIHLPVTPGKWLREETKEALKYNIVLKDTSDYEKVDKELLAGKRNWEIADGR